MSYIHNSENKSASYLMPAVTGHLEGRSIRRVFDLGCGTGDPAAYLAGRGYEVIGVDPSQDGVAKANRKYPDLQLQLGSSDDPLVERFGRWDAVLCLEVIEHVYDPWCFASAIYDLVEEGGVAIISTPYHGYLKNLALAVSGRMDAHYMPLKTHGHIKFWSARSLTTLLTGVGFGAVAINRVGRVPVLAKSMVAIAEKR